jgi:hypothetical protein
MPFIAHDWPPAHFSPAQQKLLTTFECLSSQRLNEMKVGAGRSWWLTLHVHAA